jgi:hypothetical protein
LGLLALTPDRLCRQNHPRGLTVIYQAEFKRRMFLFSAKIAQLSVVEVFRVADGAGF